MKPLQPLEKGRIKEHKTLLNLENNGSMMRNGINYYQKAFNMT